MKFSRRLIVLFLPLALIPLVLVGIYSFGNANQTIHESLETHLTALNYSKLNNFDRWIHSNKRFLESVAQRPSVVLYIEIMNSNEKNSEAYEVAVRGLIDHHLITNLTESGGITDISVMDPLTGVIVASSDETLVGKFRENRDFYMEGQEHTFVSTVEYNPAQQHNALHISTPIRNSAGKLIGVMAGHVDLGELSRIMMEDQYSMETQETYLVSAAKLLITSPKNREEADLQEVLLSDGLEDCVLGNNGFGQYENYAGIPVYGSYLWSEQWAFCILTEVELGVANQPTQRLGTITMVVGAGVSVLIIVLSIVFSRILTRPFDALLEGVHQIGVGNLDYRIPIARENEFGVLGNEINAMANNLFMSQELNEKMFAEVQGARDHLEQQVEERTKDLRMAQLATMNMFVDLEEAQKELEGQAQELKRSNEELEYFAYVASHDLQEPLRMVASYLQLIERRYNDKLDDSGREFIQYAVDGAMRMKDLINDLLAYSRVGTQGRPFEWLELNSVVGRVCANLQPTIEREKAIITVGDLPAVMADERQMVQLFQNLVANGIKFHGEEPPIILITGQTFLSPETNSEWCKVSIKDNGIGIDPQYFDRIFVIFQRLHTTNEYKGTGIGLAISKKIVERHGGMISVKSSPGNGCEFSFVFPIKHEEEV